MDKIQVTWGHAINIWWSLSWRILLFGGLAGFALGLLFGIVGTVTGADDNLIQTWSEIGGILVSIPVGIWVVKTILNKDFRKYRITLVPSLESRIEAQIHDRTND